MMPSLTRAFRRAALPLGCYYTVTLLMPLANGAAQSGRAFMGHASVVLVLPPLLVLAFWVVLTTIRMAMRARRRSGRRAI